jgi:hypothetical protein
MNKSYYKKDDPTKIVSIVDNSQDAFYQLSNGQMIKKDVFLKYYEESENIPQTSVNESFKPRKSNTGEINPDTFFTSSTIVNQNDIMKLKNADPSKGALDGQERTEIVLNTANKTKDTKPVFNESVRQPLKPIQNESIVQQVDESTLPIPDHTNTNVSQYKVYEDEDEAYNDFINNSTTPQTTTPITKPQQPKVEVDQLYEDEKLTFGVEEADRRKNLRLKRTNKPIEQEQQVQQIVQSQIDPTQMMFKTFKRNHEIKINVEFTDKIGNPDFIKLMMENMDGDIVGFYKNLIVEKIQNNFKLIEDEIEKQIKLEIFGEEKKVYEKNKIEDRSNEIVINDGMDDDLNSDLFDLVDNTSIIVEVEPKIKKPRKKKDV